MTEKTCIQRRFGTEGKTTFAKREKAKEINTTIIMTGKSFLSSLPAAISPQCVYRPDIEMTASFHRNIFFAYARVFLWDDGYAQLFSPPLSIGEGKKAIETQKLFSADIRQEIQLGVKLFFLLFRKRKIIAPMIERNHFLRKKMTQNRLISCVHIRFWNRADVPI